MRMMQRRIADPNINRLLKRFLRAGVMTKAGWETSARGVPQGGSLSPLLSNIYLHVVLDKWFVERFAPTCQGRAYYIRYADDFVACFECETDAKRFYEELPKRLRRAALSVARDKTRTIRFSRRDPSGSRTFDFLGFTHYIGKSRAGWPQVKRKTSRKGLRNALSTMTQWLRRSRNFYRYPVLWSMIRRKVQGHLNYFGVTDDYRSLSQYLYEVERIIFKWLNRRSQRRSFNWDEFRKRLRRNPLPTPRIVHRLYGTGIAYA